MLRENAVKLSDMMWGKRDKTVFHRLSKKVLNELADAMQLPAFEVRSCKGGPAVMGEVTLHTPGFYIMICGDRPAATCVMYRSCHGMRDFSGGMNHFTSPGVIGSPVFQDTLIKLASMAA